MSDDNPGPPADFDDPVLAGLAERITRRLQSGERCEVPAGLDLDPDRSRAIRGLLPLLDDLAALGRSLGRRRPRGPLDVGPGRSSSNPPAD